MDLCIKKEDISIESDGTIRILNPDLRAQVEQLAIEEPDDSVSVKDINYCRGGNCVKGCGQRILA